MLIVTGSAGPRRRAHRDPEGPAAHVSVCLALLPSGPDAVRRLKLHRFRAAVRRASLEPTSVLRGGGAGKHRSTWCWSLTAGEAGADASRRLRRQRSSQRRNGANGGRTEKRMWLDSAGGRDAGRGRRPSGEASRRAPAHAPTHSRARRAPRHSTALRAVTPAGAASSPFRLRSLRSSVCELRSLRPLRTGRAAKTDPAPALWRRRPSAITDVRRSGRSRRRAPSAGRHPPCAPGGPSARAARPVCRLPRFAAR